MKFTVNSSRPCEEIRRPDIGGHDARRPLKSVEQLVKAYPCLTVGGVRADIFNAAQRMSSRGPVEGNGLAPAIIRKGRRVLLDEIGYFTWFRTGRVDAFLQGGESASAIAEVPK